jgi:hypothetical protein
MSDELKSMWFCPECRAWNGTRLQTCLECKRARPLVPVTVGGVPVGHSEDVTLRHRVRAKIDRLTSN